LAKTHNKSQRDQFFRDNKKLVATNSSNFERWLLHRNSQHRLFGVYKSDYRAASPQQKTAYKKRAVKKFRSRFDLIFQRRNDCIHNCDRPKIAVQSSQLQDSYVCKVIEDLKFLVIRCNEDFVAEFPIYLTNLGFSPLTRNGVGA